MRKIPNVPNAATAMSEIFWRALPEFSDYEVSNFGDVRRRSTGKILKPQLMNRGYLRVTIGGKKRFVHRLVLTVFRGKDPDPERNQTNHINGVKTDNRLENLEWCTGSENIKHAYAIGLETVTPNSKWKAVMALHNGVLVGCFQSLREMCREMGFDRRGVGRQLDGLRTAHRGHTFMLL